MIRRVLMTDRADAEMEAAYLWWAENRSKVQADKWYNALVDAINSLADNPERCAVSRENQRFGFEIRDLSFGIGRRPTHRAVFTVRGDMVLVLTIRHLAQRELSPDDL